jgi:hypothetical protein
VPKAQWKDADEEYVAARMAELGVDVSNPDEWNKWDSPKRGGKIKNTHQMLKEVE